MWHPRKAFTLIEMLVAIAIVSILASILLPIISGARCTARSVECCNNLRQWSAALQMYMSQHEGYIPRRGQGVRELSTISRDSDWFNCLPPYLDELPYKDLVDHERQPRAGDKSPFICPSAAQTDGDYFLPYAMNMYLSPWIRPDPHNIVEIHAPSRVVFMADGPGPYSATAPSERAFSVVPRHNGHANVLFLDGHIRSFSGKYLGCGVGDPDHSDVRWETETEGINQPSLD